MSLKDRKVSVDLYNLLGVQRVADVVRHGRLRWFGHLEGKSGDDWVSACRKVEAEGVRCKGRNRMTWNKCVEGDMKVLGLYTEYRVQEYVEGLHIGKRLTLA